MYPANPTVSHRGPPDDRLSVIVADDDPSERCLLKETLRAAGIIVIAEASTGEQAVDLTLSYHPDVVLMDVVMPVVDGITASQRVIANSPDQRLILLADSYDEAIAVLGLLSRTVGVVSKEGSLRGVVRALRALARGEAVVPRVHTMRLLEVLRSEQEAEE